MSREDQPDDVLFRKQQPVDWTVELLGDNIIFNGQFDSEFPVSQVSWLITCLKHFQNMRLPEGVEEPEVLPVGASGGWTHDEVVKCSFGETRYIPPEELPPEITQCTEQPVQDTPTELVQYGTYTIPKLRDGEFILTDTEYDSRLPGYITLKLSRVHRVELHQQ